MYAYLTCEIVRSRNDSLDATSIDIYSNYKVHVIHHQYRRLYVVRLSLFFFFLHQMQFDVYVLISLRISRSSHKYLIPMQMLDYAWRDDGKKRTTKTRPDYTSHGLHYYGWQPVT